MSRLAAGTGSVPAVINKSPLSQGDRNKSGRVLRFYVTKLYKLTLGPTRCSRSFILRLLVKRYSFCSEWSTKDFDLLHES
jgi:hypothetical protein